MFPIKTLAYSIESEHWMSAAYSALNKNLRQQLADYSASLTRRIQYRWINDRIVNSISLRESERLRNLISVLHDSVVAIAHIEKGVGEWCIACRFNYSGHQLSIDRGAKNLGFK